MQFVHMTRKKDGSTRVDDDSRLRFLFPEIRILETDGRPRDARERRGGEGKGRQMTSIR